MTGTNWMSASFLALALLGVGAGLAQAEGMRLEGYAVNGSRNGAPLAGAEVILRAGEAGSLQIVAKSSTDRNGHFVFDNLLAMPGLIFVPGVNHDGIHYPGPRTRLPSSAVRVTAFDAVAAPSPLVVELHEIDLHIEKGVLQVTESLWVNNPSLTTYVGGAGAGTSPVTLALSIPDGFERVTFDTEFNGRRFKLRDNQLVTDIAWTPGKREVKFTYHLPIDEGKRVLEWSVNLPCARCRLCVRGEDADRFECNLPRLQGTDHTTVVFESAERTVAGEHVIYLKLGKLPTPWIVYLRWSALLILVALILATAGFRFLRRAPSKTDALLVPTTKPA